MTPPYILRHVEFDQPTNDTLDAIYTTWDTLARAADYEAWDNVEKNQAAVDAGKVYDLALITARQNRAADLEAMLADLEATQYAASYRGTA